MSFLESALELAEKGFPVFPLLPNSKLPVIDDFTARATKDPERIKKWWVDPVLGLEQPYNIGIATTRFNGSQALVVVDVDNKGKKNGSAVLESLKKTGHELPQTATQITPTGGIHIIYRAKEAVKQGTSVLGEGLDIRSKGGYIVGPGSVIDGIKYQWKHKTELAECPAWIIEKCGRVIEKEPKPEVLTKADPYKAGIRAKFYLENEAPTAIEGQSGDQVTYKVAARLKDFGVDVDQAYSLMLDNWNDFCEPPWRPEELKKKIDNAFRYGLNVPGASSPEAQFTPVGQMNETNFLQKMNEQFAVVFFDGDFAVLHETVDEKGRPTRHFLKESAFRKMFSPYTIQRQGRGPGQTYADVWFDWRGRRQYSGLCFRPELLPQNNYYNLWRGFAVKPVSYESATPSARLGFDLFMDHALNNVCQRDKALHLWLMGYFAHMIQKPYERPLTTLVFRGSKGVGKNVLLERIGRLLGQGHFLTAHNSRYLTSNFNGHLDSCLLLVLDEAFWSGDKSAESTLKGLTTSPEIMIERKGREPYMVDNLVRLAVVGNEDWLVPASSDERRYSVFDVGEGRKQDGDYFSKMKVLMDQKGGAEILIDYLKNFDLTKVNVNVAPKTEGLKDQKIESLTPFEQFWFQCLTEGAIPELDFSDAWPDTIQKSVFREAFTSYCRKRNIKSWVPNDRYFGRQLKKLCPKLGTHGKMRVSKDETRSCYKVPPLDECRENWIKATGIDFED